MNESGHIKETAWIGFFPAPVILPIRVLSAVRHLCPVYTGNLNLISNRLKKKHPRASPVLRAYILSNGFPIIYPESLCHI